MKIKFFTKIFIFQFYLIILSSFCFKNLIGQPFFQSSFWLPQQQWQQNPYMYDYRQFKNFNKLIKKILISRIWK